MTRRNVDITIGKDTYKMGMMLPSMAIKKAHVMVRNYMRARYYDSGLRMEITCNVVIGGMVYASVYGLKKNNKITIIHFGANNSN